MVTNVTPEDTQVIPRPAAAAQATPTRSNRTFLVAGLVGIVLAILAGGGALAVVGFGSGTGLFGGADPESASPPQTTEESTLSEEPTEEPEGASVPPHAPPDPAFDLLLPPLKSLTTAPIMLPAELPNELENVGINENLEGDRYGLTFLTTPPEELVGGWGRYETIGSLQAVPTSEVEPDQRFEATSTEYVELPDGTEATLSYMEPVAEVAMYDPQWEGTFDKNGYTYSLEMADYGKENVKQALSTVVEVRGEVPGTSEEFSETTESGSTAPLGDDFIADAEEAAEDYYQAAGMEDWEYTYEHLDSETQSMFTLEEWSQKNQYYWELNSITYDILSVEVVPNSEELLTEVVVRITGEDGSSFIRTTYWVQEDGEWLHRFSQEEIDLFMPHLSYEEFVEANGG